MESPPLRRLLDSLGRVQHHVYSAVVGLCAVEAGLATKPDDLDISWKAADAVGSAREARRFLVRSTMVFAAEDLAEYATAILRYRGEELPQERAERIRRLGSSQPPYLRLAPLLVSHWRNKIVHGSSAALSRGERDEFIMEKDRVSREFKNLEVVGLLRDFEADQPTLKDLTVLLAMSIRFARSIDGTLPEVSCSQEVRKWLGSLELLEDVERLEAQARNGGSSEPRARAKQLLRTKAPTLADAYGIHGAA